MHPPLPPYTSYSKVIGVDGYGMTDAGMCGESGGVACPFPVGWRLRGVALTLAWPPSPPLQAAASQGVVQQRKWKRVFGGGGEPWVFRCFGSRSLHRLPFGHSPPGPTCSEKPTHRPIAEMAIFDDVKLQRIAVESELPDEIQFGVHTIALATPE